MAAPNRRSPTRMEPRSNEKRCPKAAGPRKGISWILEVNGSRRRLVSRVNHVSYVCRGNMSFSWKSRFVRSRSVVMGPMGLDISV